MSEDEKKIEEREKILEYVRAKFMSEGFYKTSMDEIARELRISKKTIYKHFPSKEDLIEAVTSKNMNIINESIDEILDEKAGVIIKFIKLMNMDNKHMMKCSPSWFEDLRIHTPQIWDRIDDFRANKINTTLSQLLEEGKEEKLIEDIPSTIIITAFISVIRAVIRYDFLMDNHLTPNQAMDYTFTMLTKGILTEKGVMVFNKHKKEFDKTQNYF